MLGESKKSHTCYACGVIIMPREQYHRIVNKEIPPDARICNDCWELEPNELLEKIKETNGR